MTKPKIVIAGTCLSIFLLIVTAACGTGSSNSNNNSAQATQQSQNNTANTVDISNMPTLETCSVGDGNDFTTTSDGQNIKGTAFKAVCAQNSYAVVTASVGDVQGVTIAYPIGSKDIDYSHQCDSITGPRGVPPASGALYVFRCGTRVLIVYESESSTKPLVLEGDTNAPSEARFSSDGYNITIVYQPVTCPDQCVLFAVDQ